jgi:uncharacterized protein (DUF1501 family)
MDVVAGGHGMTERSDHFAVFPDMVACRKIAQRDFVAERQGFAKLERNRFSASGHHYDRVLRQGFQKHGNIVVVVQHNRLLRARETGRRLHSDPRIRVGSSKPSPRISPQVNVPSEISVIISITR